jgi:tRNA (mo5U34)-methyltransferase
MITEELRKEMDSIQWFHSIDLGELGVTPGFCKDDHVRLRYMNMPADLTEHTCLDVGTWDGFFAFEMEKRGAEKVIAADIWGDYEVLGHDLHNSGKGFEFARKVLNSKVLALYADACEVDEVVWREDPQIAFDLIVHAGVLYHLREPLESLKRVYRLLAPGGLLILETHLDLMALRRPAIAVYSGNECNRDETNYCGPNPAAVEILLKWAGFNNIAFQGGINLETFPDPNVVNQARGAWHAYK